METARQPAKIYSPKTGRAGRRSARSAVSPEAGILTAARPLDAQRTERHADDPARTTHARARLLRRRWYSQTDGRSSSPGQDHDWPPLASADVRAMAS